MWERPGQTADVRVIDFFAPVPSWAQRRLDAVGVPSPRARGALFSYEVGAADVDAELQFLSLMLWIESANEPEAAS
jgi:hypothetical protein